MVLSQVGKVDAKRGDLVRGVEAEQARFDEAHQKANAAQAELEQLQKEIQNKQRELREIEAEIKEKELRSTQLSDGINGLKNLLAAA
jgi:uncharacterized coiled-coil DUF342 family protein